MEKTFHIIFVAPRENERAQISRTRSKIPRGTKGLITPRITAVASLEEVSARLGEQKIDMVVIASGETNRHFPRRVLYEWLKRPENVSRAPVFLYGPGGYMGAPSGVRYVRSKKTFLKDMGKYIGQLVRNKQRRIISQERRQSARRQSKKGSSGLGSRRTQPATRVR